MLQELAELQELNVKNVRDLAETVATQNKAISALSEVARSHTQSISLLHDRIVKLEQRNRKQFRWPWSN